MPVLYLSSPCSLLPILSERQATYSGPHTLLLTERWCLATLSIYILVSDTIRNHYCLLLVVRWPLVSNTLETNKADQQSEQRFPFDSKGQKGSERNERKGRKERREKKRKGRRKSFAERKVQSERKINDAQENKQKYRWKFKSEILVMFTQFPVFIIITDPTHLVVNISHVQKKRPCGCKQKMKLFSKKEIHMTKWFYYVFIPQIILITSLFWL